MGIAVVLVVVLAARWLACSGMEGLAHAGDHYSLQWSGVSGRAGLPRCLCCWGWGGGAGEGIGGGRGGGEAVDAWFAAMGFVAGTGDHDLAADGAADS